MTADQWNVAIAALNVVVTLYIAYAVQRAGRNVVRMEQDRGIKDAWIEVDQVALANDDDLELLDAMIHPELRDQDRLAKRKRWLTYMVLNPLEAAWSSAAAGNMPGGALASSEKTMAAMVRDPEVFELIESFVYGSDFQRRCSELRDEWTRRNPSQPTHHDNVRPPSTRSSSPVL
jgi:hypothetical protein